MLLRSAAIGNRLKPTAIFRRDVHDNSCSHNESLNCFGRFGIVRMNQTTSTVPLIGFGPHAARCCVMHQFGIFWFG
jgi:hypothetical protein